MNKEIDDAITVLLTNAKRATKSEDAMKYAQAALNVAHVLSTYVSCGLYKKVEK